MSKFYPYVRIDKVIVKRLLTMFFSMLSYVSYGQLTGLPDANFEQGLVDSSLDIGSIDGTVPSDDLVYGEATWSRVDATSTFIETQTQGDALTAQSTTDFVTTWRTTTANESIVIPTAAAETYNYTVNWGDGNTTTNETGDATHTYATAGDYKVRISGTFPRIFFRGALQRVRDQIISIDQWGSNPWTSMYGAFFSCINLTVQATDNPNLQNVKDMSYMFNHCFSFNQDISGWDTANVENMEDMFRSCYVFDQDIGSWNTSKVRDMSHMFASCRVFNQDIGGWDTSKVQNMAGMFSGAYEFNKDLPWDTGEVTNMSYMFTWALEFNGDITNWNTSKVRNMTRMFSEARNFNQNIDSNLITGAWNTGSVVLMGGMFDGANIFNKNLNNWDTGEVWDMSYMFGGGWGQSIFNGEIGNWDTGKVSHMNGMFDDAIAFNQDIGNWNTGEVTTMRHMFRGATAFDQDIGNWDTKKVYDMKHMFSSAVAFNQDIGNWNTSNVTAMVGMFDSALKFDQNLENWDVTNLALRNTFDKGANDMFKNATLSTANYDAILRSWSSQNLNPNIEFSGGNSKYCLSATERQSIITNFNWTIIDAGLDCGGLTAPSCPVVTAPVHTATDIAINPTFIWDAADGATSYRITIGTTAGGTQFENTVLGNVLNHTPSNTLTEDTTYFVSVYASNGIGESTACAIIEFKTKVDDSCVRSTEPVTECWETVTFNETTCMWEVTGAQPEEPATECWEMTTFNDTTCMWEVTGTQPEEPATECWETATFNDTTCMWEVTGAQPEEPATECWETATFNVTTCMWEVTGTQPEEPTASCGQTVTFNTSTCSWDISGTADPEPITECWETATFNDTTCMWEVSGTQPAEPTTECWETATFNDSTCAWEVTGSQPVEPATSCGQTVMFNNTTCSWDITGVDAPLVIAPANGSSEISINPTIMWEAVEGAIGYRVTIGTSPGGTEFVDTLVANVLEYTPNKPLEENTTYFVSVFAITNMGESNFCEANEFTTEQSMVVPVTEGISPFFTPNNDGYHDTWNVEDKDNTIDYIFIIDRFGKILKKMTPESEGWDGTYMGKPMVEDDYWYVIVHDSGKQEKGHFSLIKR